MNYLAEIRLFYDRLEMTPLSPAAIALWHGLMYLAHKAGWPEELSIPVSTLEARAQLERRNVYRTRMALKEVGLIDFREREGNRSALYKLIPLYHFDTQSVAQSVPQTDTENVPQPVAQTPVCSTDLTHKTSPYIDKNISLSKKIKIDFIHETEWRELVESWLEYKRSRNENYKSELSVKKFHTMLRNYARGDPALARTIIDKSIANNWAGIFAPTPTADKAPATGQRIGQIKQPEDDERRRKLLDKFNTQK